MAIYVYHVSDGTLVSWCPSDTDPVAPAAQLSAQGMASVSGLAPLDASHVWDAPTKTVKTITPAAAPVWIPTWKFILLFTPAENAAIRASTDTTVQHFFDALRTTPQINLSDPIVAQGVNYLVSVSLLTQSNANLILSGQQST